MVNLYWFPDPNSFLCQMRVDITGAVIIAVPATHPTGRVGQVFNLPDDTPFGHTGADLDMSLAGYEPMHFRGILNLAEDGLAYINIDDVHGIKKVICPEVPVPIPPNPIPPSNDPEAIIRGVYATGKYELITKEGCGKFTEACCDELHKRNSRYWGYIKTSGAQNGYNGHRLDKLNLLRDIEDTKAGVYDIIKNSESTDAEPAFNFEGTPIPELWYYPA